MRFFCGRGIFSLRMASVEGKNGGKNPPDMMNAHILLQCVSSQLKIYSSNRFLCVVKRENDIKRLEEKSEPPLQFLMHSCASDALNQKVLLEEKPNCEATVTNVSTKKSKMKFSLTLYTIYSRHKAPDKRRQKEVISLLSNVSIIKNNSM